MIFITISSLLILLLGLLLAVLILLIGVRRILLNHAALFREAVTPRIRGHIVHQLA